jgi:hypothetical protein
LKESEGGGGYGIRLAQSRTRLRGSRTQTCTRLRRNPTHSRTQVRRSPRTAARSPTEPAGASQEPPASARAQTPRNGWNLCFHHLHPPLRYDMGVFGNAGAAHSHVDVRLGWGGTFRRNGGLRPSIQPVDRGPEGGDYGTTEALGPSRPGGQRRGSGGACQGARDGVSRLARDDGAVSA